MVMRCLIVAVGAALARGDARRSGNLQEKIDAVASALNKGEFSVLNDVEAVRDYLDAGWDANKRHGDHGVTLLHFTAAYGDPKVVQLLVEYGADVRGQHVPVPTRRLVVVVAGLRARRLPGGWLLQAAGPRRRRGSVIHISIRFC